MMLGHIANKQFKSDSARLAFLVRVWFSVYGGQMKCRGCVLHTLMRRYTLIRAIKKEQGNESA